MSAPCRRWHGRYTVLALCTLAYFGVRFSEYVVSVLYVDIKAGVGVSDLVLGVGFTVGTATYALSQLPSGVLGDRFGERRVVLWALGGTALGSLLLALSTSVALLVGGMALLGGVSGAYYSPATSLLADRFAATGRAIGVHRLGAQVVGFTGPLVTLAAVAAGWRVVLALGGGVALVAFAGFSTFVSPRSTTRPDGSMVADLTPGALWEVLADPPVAFTTGVAALAQFADTATFSFLVGALSEFHGLSAPLAGTLFAVYFGATTVAQPVAGTLSDRVGRDRVTVAVLVVGSGGYLLLAARRGLPETALGVCLVGVGMGWGPPVQSRLVDHLPTEGRGRGFGLVRTVYIGFAALCGVVVGGLVTLVGWGCAFVLLAVVLALPAGALLANRALTLGY